MKKFWTFLLIFGGINAALFAQMQLSAGLGGNFTADFTTFSLTKDAKNAGKNAEDSNSRLFGGGIYAFFDASYVEANIGFLFGNANQYKQPEGASDDEKKGTDVTALKLGLFGKFPIALGNVTFFPMLGIDGQIWLAGKHHNKTINTTQEKNDARDEHNQFWFKAGIGFDIPVVERFYFRAEALYGLRLNTKFEQDALKDTTRYETVPVDPGDPDYEASDPTTWFKQESHTYPSEFSAILGHGLDIRLSVGFKF